jgi:hypothetical protein
MAVENFALYSMAIVPAPAIGPPLVATGDQQYPGGSLRSVSIRC